MQNFINILGVLGAFVLMVGFAVLFGCCIDSNPTDRDGDVAFGAIFTGIGMLLLCGLLSWIF